VREVYISRRRAVLAPGIFLAFCRCASGLDPSLANNQHAHTGFTVSEGHVKGVIYAMAQIPDGYLWLGKEFGPVCFDGVRPLPCSRPPANISLASTFETCWSRAMDVFGLAPLKGLPVGRMVG